MAVAVVRVAQSPSRGAHKAGRQVGGTDRGHPLQIRPGTWLTVFDTLAPEVTRAVAGDIFHGRAIEIPRGLFGGRPDNDRPVCGVRRESADGVSLGGALSGGGLAGSAGPLAATAHESRRDGAIAGRGTHCRAPTSSHVGAAEITRAVAATRAAGGLAG